MKRSLAAGLCALAITVGALPAAVAQSHAPATHSTRLIVPSTHTAGDRLSLRVEDLPPGTIVRVSALRRFGRWMQGTNGNWVEVLVLLESWAEFRVPRTGAIDLNRDRPLRGTWRRADARDILWSGEPVETFGRAAPRSGSDVEVRVTKDGDELAKQVITLANGRADLVTANIEEDGFSAAYAAPPSAGPHPVMMVLHGSEGGDRDMAAISAARFASRGYATLAINYFARPHKGMTHITPRLADIPVELLTRARTWLAARPDADLDRIGVWGVSKGAEFATVAAANLDWIDAVVACVPSDVVWEGDGGGQPGPAPSSWSVGGVGLPYISTPADDPNRGRFINNTARYEAGWQATSAADRAAAAIPIEQAQARFLFIGADRDEIWASGRMARAAMQRLSRRGRASGSELLVFDRSGHMICGDGVFPGRVYATQRSERWAKSLQAEGEDQVIAWDRTLDFLNRTLQPGK